jgi:hypothetical protein
MRWSRYLASLPAEPHDALVTALTLGIGHLQRAAQLRQTNRPLTAVVGALATAYAALTTAVALAALPTAAAPLPVPAAFGARSEERLVLPWSAFGVAHPTTVVPLATQLAQVNVAGGAMRQTTVADAPVEAVLAAVQQCLVALAGVRQRLAG